MTQGPARADRSRRSPVDRPQRDRPLSDRLAKTGTLRVSGKRDTLHAALADQRAAAQLKAGRLTDTLAGGGFPPTGAATSARPSSEQAVAERAKAAAQEAAVLVSRLRAKLDEAEIEASRLEQQQRALQAELDSANRTVQMARRRLDEADERREGLSR